MSMTPQNRAAWAKKFARLVTARTAAEEAVLVAIHEATEGGLTQADIAYMIGGVSPSIIKAKALKGKAVLEGRKKA